MKSQRSENPHRAQGAFPDALKKSRFVIASEAEPLALENQYPVERPFVSRLAIAELISVS